MEPSNEMKVANALSDTVLPMRHGYLRLRSRFVVLFFGVTLGGCRQYSGRVWP